MRRAPGNGRFFVCLVAPLGRFWLPSPSQRKALCHLPRGGGKRTCVNLCKVCGKAKLKKVRLTTKFSSAHGRKLGSPSGRAGAKRLRGEQSGAPGPLRRLRRHLPRTRGRQEPKGCVLALPRAGELSSEARLRGLYTKLSPPCAMGANRAGKIGSKEKKAKTKNL